MLQCSVLQNITQNQLTPTNTIPNEITQTPTPKIPQQEQTNVSIKTPEKPKTNPTNEIALPVVQVSQHGLTPTQEVVVTNKPTLPKPIELSKENLIQAPTVSVPGAVKQSTQIQEVKAETKTEAHQQKQQIYNVETTDVEATDEEFPLIEDYPVIQADNTTVKKDGESIWRKMRKGISSIFYF